MAVDEKKYHGRMTFHPDVSKLRPGDVVLTRHAEDDGQKARLTSMAIRRASGGTFSHAMICSLSPTCVEAVSKGVMVTSLQRCFAHDLANVRVLRYPDAAIAAQAAANAQREVGRGYSKRKAVASVFPEKIIEELRNKGTFCSALVAQVFMAAGAREFEAISVQKTTPATLERMDIFLDVTAKIFEEKLAPRNILEMSALDGNRVASLADEQSAITERYADELESDADDLVLRYPKAELTPPNTFYDDITLVMHAFESEEDIDEGEREAFLAAVRAFDIKLSTLIESGELLDLSQRMAAADEADHQRSLAEALRPAPDIDLASLRNFFSSAQEQLRQRRGALQNFKAWDAAHSKVARTVLSWIAFQEATMGSFERREPILREIIDRISARRSQTTSANAR